MSEKGLLPLRPFALPTQLYIHGAENKFKSCLADDAVKSSRMEGEACLIRAKCESNIFDP